MTLGKYVYRLATLAIENGGWMELDRLYLQNQILSEIGVTTPVSFEKGCELEASEIIDILVEEARKHEKIHHAKEEVELRGKLYDLLTPPPAVFNAYFSQLYDKDPERAFQYLEKIGYENQTLKEKAESKYLETQLGKLMYTKTNGTYEENIPTENEKYPRCGLCFENEGYNVKGGAPFRYIRMNLQGESFGLRLVPYPLWNEHSLFVAQAHQTLMHSRKTVDQLLQLAYLFPGHFIACDSDLLVDSLRPQHVVYQGGKDDVPLLMRKEKATFTLRGYEEVDVAILDYPLTVCRLRAKEGATLLNLGTEMMQQWRTYDLENSPAFKENGSLNHSVMMVAQKEEEMMSLYLCFLASDTPYALHLAQGLGVAAIHGSLIQEEMNELRMALENSDPFQQNPRWIDEWMQHLDNRLERGE